MSNWNGKLKCIKGWEFGNENKLTEGKIYEVKDGRYYYDDGKSSSGIYDNFDDFVRRNEDLNNHLTDVLEEDLTYLLKTGRVAETRDGAKYLIIRDIDTENYGHQEWGLVDIDGFLTSQDYDINLKEINSDTSFDVVKIYQENSIDKNQLSCKFMDIENKNYLVWERKEEKQVRVVRAVHFGNKKTYTWIDEEKRDIAVDDIVQVDTRFGEQLVQVKDTYIVSMSQPAIDCYKKVIRHLGIPHKKI